MNRFGTRRLVFVDRSAFAALGDAGHPRRDEVRAELDVLLREYERGDTVLRTHAGMAVAELSAVCEIEPLRPWLISCAQQTIADNPELELDVDAAAALVLLEREHIGEIMTIDPLHAALGLTTLP